eukprot:Pgem_evm1s12338
MNESAIDSLQNGLVASISGAITPYKNSFKPYSKVLGQVSFTRGVVVILNIPLIIVAVQKLSVIKLFLLGNILTTMGSFPL